MIKRAKKGITIDEIEKAIKDSAGILSEAARSLGCSQANVSQRVAKSPRLKKVMEDYTEIYVGIAESQLRKHMDEGNPSVCMFFLKCKGGYSEKRKEENDSKLTYEQILDIIDAVKSKSDK